MLRCLFGDVWGRRMGLWPGLIISGYYGAPVRRRPIGGIFDGMEMGSGRGASRHSMTVPTTIEGTGQSSSGRWQATQQTDRHCCGRILTSRAHDPNRVAGQRKTGADFNSSIRGKPEAKPRAWWPDQVYADVA